MVGFLAELIRGSCPSKSGDLMLQHLDPAGGQVARGRQCLATASSARIASIWPTACVLPSCVPVARIHSMASALGMLVSIDMRVPTTSTATIETRVVAGGLSV